MDGLIESGEADSLTRYRYKYLLDKKVSTIEGAVFETSFTKFLNHPTRSITEKNCEFRVVGNQKLVRVQMTREVKMDDELILIYNPAIGLWNL